MYSKPEFVAINRHFNGSNHISIMLKGQLFTGTYIDTICTGHGSVDDDIPVITCVLHGFDVLHFSTMWHESVLCRDSNLAVHVRKAFSVVRVGGKVNCLNLIWIGTHSWIFPSVSNLSDACDTKVNVTYEFT